MEQLLARIVEIDEGFKKSSKLPLETLEKLQATLEDTDDSDFDLGYLSITQALEKAK